MKTITLITLFVGALAFITNAYASVSGNLGVTSDYLWRGTTQSNGEASVSGGLDYAGDSYYAGAWVGSIVGGEELDLYIGTDIQGFDVGVIKYIAGGAETTEYYVGYSVSGFDLSYAVEEGASENDFYSVSYGFDISESLSATLTVGDYYSTGDYTQLDVAYGDLTVTIVDSDVDDHGDVSYAVSYGWSL